MILTFGDFAGYIELATANYVLAVKDPSGTITVAPFDAALADLALEDEALVLVASLSLRSLFCVAPS